MKVIFLDIDGVVNYVKSRWSFDHVTKTSFLVPEGQNVGWYGIDPEKVKIILSIVEKTKAKIVLSSTWRKHEDWLETMALNGFSSELFLGRTIHNWDFVRGQEIQIWLDEHREIEKYAIIDDDSDMLDCQKDSFFQTSFEYGITEEIADRVINHLNKV